MKLNFKLFNIILLAAAIVTAAGCEKKWDESQWPEIPQRPDPVPNTGNYSFSGGKMSHEVLNNYLSRAITMQEFLCGPECTNDGDYGTEDDERMLLNIGAKFIGRAIFVWNHEEFFLNDTWLANAKAKIERMHEKDFCDHHDHFVNTTPQSEWKTCLAHAEEIGLGSREYELIEV